MTNTKIHKCWLNLIPRHTSALTHLLHSLGVTSHFFAKIVVVKFMKNTNPHLLKTPPLLLGFPPPSLKAKFCEHLFLILKQLVCLFSWIVT